LQPSAPKDGRYCFKNTVADGSVLALGAASITVTVMVRRHYAVASRGSVPKRLQVISIERSSVSLAAIMPR
jgi:hypothetical protein